MIARTGSDKCERLQLGKETVLRRASYVWIRSP